MFVDYYLHLSANQIKVAPEHDESRDRGARAAGNDGRGEQNGMKTLHQDSMLKVKMALTTVEEALSNVPPDLIL